MKGLREWGGFILGLTGTLLALFNSFQGRQTARTARSLELKRLLDEAADEMQWSYGVDVPEVLQEPSWRDFAHDSERVKNAGKKIDDALEIEPTHARALCQKGLHALAMGDRALAVKNLTAASTVFRETPDVRARPIFHVPLALAQALEGNTGAALATLSECEAQHHGSCTDLTGVSEFRETNWQSHLQLGAFLESHRFYEAAARCYSRATEIAPTRAEIYVRLGGVLANRGHLADALSAFSKATQLDPQSVPALLNLGAAKSEAGDLPGAEEACSRALQIDALSAPAHKCRGDVLLNRGSLDEAIDSYAHAIRLNPAYVAARNNRGVGYWKKKDYAASIDHYSKALEFDIHYAYAWNNLGVAHRAQGHSQLALDSLQEAIRSDSQLGAAYFNLARVLTDLGRLGEAGLMMEKARSLDASLSVDAPVCVLLDLGEELPRIGVSLEGVESL